MGYNQLKDFLDGWEILAEFLAVSKNKLSHSSTIATSYVLFIGEFFILLSKFKGVVYNFFCL